MLELLPLVSSATLDFADIGAVSQSEADWNGYGLRQLAYTTEIRHCRHLRGQQSRLRFGFKFPREQSQDNPAGFLLFWSQR